MTSGGRPSIRPTQALLNKLRHRFTRYFRAYYKALREEIRRFLAEGGDPDSVPHYYEWHKKIQVALCYDGVMVVHLPVDPKAVKDEFEFYLSRDETVKGIPCLIRFWRAGRPIKTLLQAHFRRRV